MDYDFIEIGTADFDTLTGKASDEDVGICIEPISEYLYRLPSPKRVSKFCVAVSNYDGKGQLFRTTETKIKEKELPKWVKGCSSLGKEHPTVPDEHQEAIEVRVVTPATIIKQFEVTGIKRLKVDCEGMDCLIVNGFLDSTQGTGALPAHITMEFNSLSDQSEIFKIIKRLLRLGYSMRQLGDNIEARQ